MSDSERYLDRLENKREYCEDQAARAAEASNEARRNDMQENADRARQQYDSFLKDLKGHV